MHACAPPHAQAQIAGWVKAEDIKRDNAAAKNELEAYVIKTREALDGDEGIIKVRTFRRRRRRRWRGGPLEGL